MKTKFAIILAAVMAPTVAAPAWAGGPESRSEPSCTIVFKDIDTFEEAVRALGNSDSPLYNCARQTRRMISPPGTTNLQSDSLNATTVIASTTCNITVPILRSIR
jgi:hypothetical protein